jgi:dTDP-4-amino-4,6-dideoxygalactose transaminase
MDYKIPFNKPFLTGKELEYIKTAVGTGKLSGNGKYTLMCHDYFQKRYHFQKCLLTSSCTDALEMAAILLDIQPGDEVIMPSYTFVSTANAFVLRGAKIIFVDSRKEHPGMDETLVEKLITTRTKAIVPVHYAGIACNMEKIMELANRYNVCVVEDAAQAIDSFYKNQNEQRALGAFGHLSAFSFHETKNIIAGEGGMLVVNDSRFANRAEIIWEKGTNRSAFFRGEVDKYGWVDMGSSFLPSELTAAFLWAQLECLDMIQEKRKSIWEKYQEGLKTWAEGNGVRLPAMPSYASNNGHMFYIVCRDIKQRTSITSALRSQGILAVFHYQSLHSSPYYSSKHDGRPLPFSDLYTDCLLRLPLYYELSETEIDAIISIIKSSPN